MFFLSRGRRRRYRKSKIQLLVNQLLYMDQQKQYVMIVVCAVAMAIFVFSGLLLFRQSDQGDLLNRGEWLMAQGKSALAVKELERLVHLHRGSYEGHLALGKAYMEIDETEKAEKEFRIASRLRAKNPEESGAHVAISRLMIVQGNYQDAEKQLFQAYRNKRNRKDRELLMAIVDLYEDWGDHYVDDVDPPNYEKAFLKYAVALRYVHTLGEHNTLKDKLVKTASHLADYYDNIKEYDKAIAVLRRALRYDYSSQNLIKIAQMYEQKKDYDQAIFWYRKVYQIDPQIISLKLSDLLIQKGRELSDAHQSDDARQFFEEAQRINDSAKLPLNTIYPVKAKDIKLSYDFNKANNTLTPIVSFDLMNDSVYSIGNMNVKASFVTVIGEPLAETTVTAITNNTPLSPKDQQNSDRVIKIKATEAIPAKKIAGTGTLRVRVSVSYGKDQEQAWFDVTQAEVAVSEVGGHKSDTEPPTDKPAAKKESNAVKPAAEQTPVPTRPTNGAPPNPADPV